MNMYDEKYQQKSQSIPSVEPNYFVHFAMRYPVLHKKEKNFQVKMQIHSMKN